VTGSYYSTDQLWNNAGNKTPQAQYSNYIVNPYLEYGLADGITVGANLLFMRAQQDLVPEQSNWGMGDSEFFVRGRLWQHGGLVIPAEPMVKLPSPESSRDLPVIGSRHPDAGLGLAAGYVFV